MLTGIVLGTLGAFAATRFFLRRRRCAGRGGFGRFRHGFGPGGLYRLSRQLDLSPNQRSAVEELARELRQTFWEVRSGLRGELDPALEALGAEAFDRARIEEVAERQMQAAQRLKKQLVDGLERLHDILIPEQREKLRAFFGRFRPAAAADAGPYR